jgi:hypothetical protein
VNGDNFKIRVYGPQKQYFYAYFGPVKTMSTWRVSCDAANPKFKLLMQGVQRSFTHFQHGFIEKALFSERAKTDCFMEMGSGINHNLELRSFSSKTALICARSSV